MPLAHACNVWAPDWHILTEREAVSLGWSSSPRELLGKRGVVLVVFSAIVADECTFVPPPAFVRDG